MNTIPVLAYFDPATLALSIPLVGMMIPIVAILVKHQQRMAEIMHGSAGPQAQAEVAQLRTEVYELKQMLHQQMIAVDSIISSPNLTHDQRLPERLEQTK